ncbi:MAG: hypothetical protein ACYDHY_19915, partial [Acidiferrobacterales bacterium]
MIKAGNTRIMFTLTPEQMEAVEELKKDYLIASTPLFWSYLLTQAYKEYKTPKRGVGRPKGDGREPEE